MCGAVRPELVDAQDRILPSPLLCLISGEETDIHVDDKFPIGAEYAVRLRRIGMLDAAFDLTDVGHAVAERLATLRRGPDARDPHTYLRAAGFIAALDVCLRANLNLSDPEVRRGLVSQWLWALQPFVEPEMIGDQYVLNFMLGFALTLDRHPQTSPDDPPAAAAAIAVNDREC